MGFFQPQLEGQWRAIPGFPDYGVSEDGRIANKATGLEISRSINNTGHLKTTISRDRLRNTLLVSRCVAEAFLDRDGVPEFFDTPIHLDGDKTNCHVDNLAWRPRWFAVAYHKQFKPENSNARSLLSWGVYIRDTDEVFADSFDAAKKYGWLNSDIVEALANDHPIFPHQYTLEYVKPDDPMYPH